MRIYERVLRRLSTGVKANAMVGAPGMLAGAADSLMRATLLFIHPEVMEIDVVPAPALLFSPFPDAFIEWDTHDMGGGAFHIVCEDGRSDAGSMASYQMVAGALDVRGFSYEVVQGELRMRALSSGRRGPAPETLVDATARHLAAVLTYVNMPRGTRREAPAPISRLKRERLRKAGLGDDISMTSIRLSVTPDEARRLFERAREVAHPGTRPLHLVREHLRRYPSGKIVTVKSHKRGSAENGVRVAEYEVVA